VSFTFTLQKSVEFPVHFRVPGWSKSGIVVKINGAMERVNTQPGTWAEIKRNWKSGDTMELQIPLELSLAEVDKRHPNRVAVCRGPVVLVRQGQQPLNSDFSQWKVQDGEPLIFQVGDQATSRFVPFYRIARGQPYVMYFDLGS
jgi:DUF1680 family protein